MRTSRSGPVLAVAVLCAFAASSTGCTSFKVKMLLKEGNTLYTAQKYEEAIQRYDKILEIEPANWDANYLKAVSYLALYHPNSELPKDKEYAEKGIAAFEKTLGLDPPNADAKAKTEKYYLSFLGSAGDNAKAITYLEKQLESRPNDLALIMQIAALYHKNGDYPNSLLYYEKRATLDPQNKEAWYTLGVNCWDRSYHGGAMVSQEEREKVVDKGIKAFQSALAIDPKYFDALSYINLIYREKAKAMAAVGKNKEAADAYLEADKYQKQAIEVRKEQVAKQKAG